MSKNEKVKAIIGKTRKPLKGETSIEELVKPSKALQDLTVGLRPTEGGAIHFREIAGKVGRGIKELARKGVRTAGVAAREARETVEPYAREFTEIEMEAYRRRRLGQPTTERMLPVPGYVYAPATPVYMPPMRISGLPMKTFPLGTIVATVPKPMACTNCRTELATGERAFKYQNFYLCPHCGGRLTT